MPPPNPSPVPRKPLLESHSPGGVPSCSRAACPGGAVSRSATGLPRLHGGAAAARVLQVGPCFACRNPQVLPLGSPETSPSWRQQSRPTQPARGLRGSTALQQPRKPLATHQGVLKQGTGSCLDRSSRSEHTVSPRPLGIC